jgi:heat shock protein HslJ
MLKRTAGRFQPLVGGVALVFVSLLLPQSLSAALPSEGQVPVQLPPPPVAPTPGTPTLPAASGTSTPSLTQGVWLWVRTVYGDGTVIQSRDPNVYTVAFMSDGRVAIRADCNTGSATYTTAGSALSIQPGSMTLAACPAGSQDSVFLRDLFATTTFEFDGPQLVFNLEMDHGVMYFSPQSLTALVGRTWRVTGVNNGKDAVVSLVSGTQVSMMFGADNRISGNATCNTYIGPYTLSGSSISFGALVTTRRACEPEAANEQEQQFLVALNNTTTYELNGDRLTFRDNVGAIQLTAVRPTVEPPPRP